MKKLLFENLGLKISAILISIFLWVFVTSGGYSEMSFDLPVEIMSVPPELGVVSVRPKKVSVTVRGQERRMKSLTPSDIRVFVDLGKSKPGEENYIINRDDIKLPYSMSVRRVNPSSVTIRLEEIVTRTVEVKPFITGFVKKGFRISSIKVEPRSVTIQGLKTEVERIKALRTEEMDISGLSGMATEELNIDIEGYDVRLPVNNVKVEITITEEKR